MVTVRWKTGLNRHTGRHGGRFSPLIFTLAMQPMQKTEQGLASNAKKSGMGIYMVVAGCLTISQDVPVVVMETPQPTCISILWIAGAGLTCMMWTYQQVWCIVLLQLWWSSIGLLHRYLPTAPLTWLHDTLSHLLTPVFIVALPSFLCPCLLPNKHPELIIFSLFVPAVLQQCPNLVLLTLQK